jgi:hypothetical protein
MYFGKLLGEGLENIYFFYGKYCRFVKKLGKAVGKTMANEIIFYGEIRYTFKKWNRETNLNRWAESAFVVSY